MTINTDYWPLDPYADIDLEAFANELHALSVQSAEAGPRLSFNAYLAYHHRIRECRIDYERRPEFHSFARGFSGPGDLTIPQWDAALFEYFDWLDDRDKRDKIDDARDEQDTQACARDVGVQ